MDNLIGTTLGQYEIVEKIGQGGMALVFKAYQRALDRFVAIKVLSPALAEEPGFAERFQREAQAVARLHHPNILQVYDFGLHNKSNYLVMRYVPNSITLGQLIRGGTPTHKLIEYILQVADALNYAHEQGIVHRDVKPSNILIDGKWALLGDFGLVKLNQSSSHLTTTGMGMGTPAYMSPEQVVGMGVDRRSDIYALGVILYRILTGAIPHDAPTPMAIMVKRKTEPVTPLHEIKPDVSISLEQVVLRSLADKPDDRYSTAADFALALQKAETDPNYREPTLVPVKETTLVSTVKEWPTPPPAQKTGSSRFSLGLIAGGAIGIVGLIAGLIFLLSSAPSRTTDQPAAQLPTSEQPAITVTPNNANPLPSTAMPTTVSPAIPRVRVKSKLAIRGGPGAEYDLLGHLPAGTSAEVTGRDETEQWWQIKSSLAAAGVAWVQADSNAVEVTDVENVPIALAPPTPAPSTATPTSTPTATPPPDTPSSTPTIPPATPTSTATPPRPTATLAPPTQAAPSTPTQAPSIPEGQLTLLNPPGLEPPSFGPTEFEWQWGGELGPDQGFEVRVWREGEPPSGVHNAVEDNLKGTVVALGNNRYRLTVNIRDAFGVKGRSGEYLWTVALVQISPEYKDLGIQAPPGRLRFEAGGGGGGGGDGGGGGGKDPGSI